MVNMKYKSICFITNESIKNMGSVRDYFIEQTERFVTFHYPHGYSQQASHMEIYDKGKLVLSKIFPCVLIPNNIVKQLLHWVYVHYIVLRWVPRNSFVIVENPLFCLSSRFFRIFKHHTFVLWIGDYYPKVTGMMKVYRALTFYHIRHLPYVLYESPPLQTIYESIIKVNHKEKFRKMINLGIKKGRKVMRTIKGNTITLGFIGVLRNQQGLDLIFQYLTHAQSVTLEIIGNGYWKKYYQDLAKRLQIEDKVTFFGYVENPERIIRHWNIGVALYEEGGDNLSKYCEPTKMKDYLCYGLPVITTKTTYFAAEIEKFHAGCVVDENPKSLHQAIAKVRADYEHYTNGVEAIVKKYEYASWYNKKFSFLQGK